MSETSKYYKLTEYLKTHYTFHAQLGRYYLGDREQGDAQAKWRMISDIMDFVENLELEDKTKEEHRNNLIPLPSNFMPAAAPVEAPAGNDVITFGDYSPVSVASSVVTAASEKDWNDFWKDDGISIVGNPYAAPDTISLKSSITGSGILGGLGGVDTLSFDEPQYYTDIHGMVAGELPEKENKEDTITLG